MDEKQMQELIAAVKKMASEMVKTNKHLEKISYTLEMELKARKSIFKNQIVC